MTVIGLRPVVCVMAQTAFLCRIKVILVLAGCRSTVVTRRAGSEHLGVVDSHHWRPNSRAVAVLADVCGLRVLRMFASRIATVMAAYTIVRDIRMVENRGYPAGGRVTIVAIIAALYMRRVLAGCRSAIVARYTTADDVRVIDREHRRKYVGRVAVLADVACRYMLRMFARRVSAVMTAHTISGDIRVVKRCGRPARCCMAVIAVVATGDMVRMFAGGRIAVVAGTAAAEHLAVIDSEYRRKYVSRMTVLADVT